MRENVRLNKFNLPLFIKQLRNITLLFIIKQMKLKLLTNPENNAVLAKPILT